MKTMTLTQLAAALTLAGLSGLAIAANSITQIELLKNAQEQQVLAVTFSNPLPVSPNSFAISNPPRVAFDFPDTRNQTGKTQLPFAASLLNAATVVEGQGKARLVLNLNKSTAYTSKLEDNKLLITLNAPGSASQPVSAPASRIQEAPTEILPPVFAAAPNAIAPNGVVQNVDFKRGDNGEARVLIDLNSASTPVDIKREGKNVVIDLAGVKVPRHLERRLDVTDFATPTRRIDATNQGAGSRIVLQSEGDWAYSSYQTDKRLVVEVRKISAEEVEAALQAQGKASYKGEKLSLNFQNVEVRSLLQVIAEFTGMNIITSDSVNGTLTLRLKDVPWDQALDLILAQKNLEKRQVGNVVRIAPRDELLAIERQAAESQKQRVNAEPIITETFQIKYRAAEEIREALKDLAGFYSENVTTSQGSSSTGTKAAILVDPRSNKIIIRERVSVIEEIRKVIQTLDTPLRQVLIEARIVEAKDNFQKDLGVRLQVTKVGGDTSVGNLSNGGSIPIGQLPSGDVTFNPNVSLPTSLSGASIAAVFKGASSIIGLELSAMQAEDRGKVVSSPRILTADRTKATITEGTEIPYQTTDKDGNSSTTFKKANLTLAVTPQVTPENDVVLKLNITKDTPNTKLKVGENPAIDNKTVDTEVRVENGGTVVIGGIYVQEQNTVENRVPLLGDLPVVGALFRNNSNTNNRRELLVFITPRIVENEFIPR